MKTMAEVLGLHFPNVESGYPQDKYRFFCDATGCDFQGRTDYYGAGMSAFIAHQAAALSTAWFGPVREAAALIRDLTDPEDCSFDHHGGCQAHGYLGLQPGEMCPQLQAKAWAYNHRESTTK